MDAPRRLLLAAACFAFALSLPFGRTGGTFRTPTITLAQPLLVVEPGTRAYGPNGEPIAMPGRLRMQYVPLFIPGSTMSFGDALPGRAVTARVPLVALLAAALLLWRRRSSGLAFRAALAGAVALVACGVLGALPSSGAALSILGIGLLATAGAPTLRT